MQKTANQVGSMRQIARYLAGGIYYGFARHLPVSYSPMSLGLARPLRGMLCRLMVKKCGRHINIERGAEFGFDLEIGDNSGIGINAIVNTGGGVVIGRNVMMGREVAILTQDHGHEDTGNTMMDQGYVKDGVVVEDDVWIGMRAIILSGVRIGRSSIIGAGAIVTRDVPPFTIAAGNPARVVKRRDSIAA